MAKRGSFVKQLGKMNLDKGFVPGDHMWCVKNAILTETGYEQMPEKKSSFTFGGGQTPKGAHYFRGSVTARSYVALSSTLWELDSGTTATDVTGNALTNTTNGVTFANYGEFCFASNGVDPIQAIRVPSSTGSTSVNFLPMDYTDDGAQIAPKYIFSHKNHLLGANATMLASYSQLGTHTTAAGSAFTNQPAGDAVEVLSSSGADTTQSTTIYGTRVGQGDAVSFEVVALNGTGVVSTVTTDWNRILAVKVGVCAGTVTWREASGNATITTAAPAVTSVGVDTPSTAIPSGGQTVTIVADGATTRQIGLSASDWSGGVLYDSQALSGTTSVQSNERLDTVLEVFIGDLENTRTVTITTFEFATGSEHPYALWISATDVPESFGKITVNPTFTGVELLQLFDGVGEITGGIDGGDCCFVFKEGSVHRIDGPPFVPTVISYSIGMPARCTPYRQADKIYFWATSGLHSININTNEVTNVFSGRMLRSVSDYANANFGLITGQWPNIETITSGPLVPENVAATESQVHISGDSRYGYVLMSFQNDSLGGGLLMYQSIEDCFVVPGNAGGYQGLPWEVDSGNPYPMSALRICSDTGASNTVSKWNLTSLWGREEAFLPLFVFPYDRFVARDTAGRIVRIRPVFEDLLASAVTEPYFGSSDVRVISDSVNNKNWRRHTVTQFDSYSKDGWFTFSSCPNASGHAIVLMIYEETGQNSSIGAFSTIEVEVEIAPGRSA